MGGLNWYRQANNTSSLCLITLTTALGGLWCQLIVLSSSDSFEVHHLRKSHVLVPFVHVGWSCSVPETIILAADLCKIQRFFCPKIKRKECRQNHAIILMYLMSLIKNHYPNKQTKDLFVCFWLCFFLKWLQKRGTPKEENTRKNSVITL